MKTISAVVITLMLISFILPLQEHITYLQIKYDLREDFVMMPGEFAIAFLISGFRGLAADLLWLKIDEFWHEGKWYNMPAVLRAVTWIQKDFISAWSLAAWHLAYNLSSYEEDEAKKQLYVNQGLGLLKEGMMKNPDRYELYFELGWLYYDKVKNYDEAIKYFRRATRFTHPSYIDRLIAHAYAKKNDLENAKKEWERCLGVFQDDIYHIGLAKKNLKKIDEQLRGQ